MASPRLLLASAAACASLLGVAACSRHATGANTGSSVDAATVRVGSPGAPGGGAQQPPSSGGTTGQGDSGLAMLAKRSWPPCMTPAVLAPADDDAGVSPYDDTCLIDEEHGVFADAARGDDSSADGSRDRPYASLQAAINAAAAAAKDVYACGGTYAGPILIGSQLASGLRVFGSLSCDTFQPDPAAPRTHVQAKGAGPALSISDTSGIVIARVDFEDLASDHAPGTTYVGALISNAHQVLLQDVALRAPDGEPGADGVAPDPAPAAGAAGSPGADACAGNPSPGGTGGINSACPKLSQTTSGGNGGDGAIGTGNGSAGSSQIFGNGGQGETPGSGWSCSAGSGLGPGQAGGGYEGAAGSGAKGFGAFVGGRFLGFSGQDGAPGNTSYGGGGGGGALAPSSCPGGGTATGASGGGGGSGGCGGKGGKGGRPGGSSFGLIVANSSVQLEGGAIHNGNGGKGGDGALGQPGGKGGAGAPGGKGSGGSHDACAGGAGGDGGAGGPGGGGNGGHAIGVLYIGKRPLMRDVAGATATAASHGGEPGGGPPGTDPNVAMSMLGTAGTAELIHEM